MKKKKKVKNLSTKHKIIKYIGIVIIFFGFLYYTLSPNLVEVRNSLGAVITAKVIITLIIYYLSFSEKIDMPILGKITMLSLIVIIWILSFVDINRIQYFIFMMYGFANIGISIYIYYINKKSYKSMYLFGCFSFLLSVSPILKIHIIDTSFPFWEPALVFAIISFFPTLWVSIFKKHIYTDKENVIAAPILALMVGFIIPWLSINSLNYCFDYSVPTYETFSIIDKDIQTGARRTTTYNFKVEKNGETFKISVDDTVYYSYELGDDIDLSVYKGAFNVSYYIYEDKN